MLPAFAESKGSDLMKKSKENRDYRRVYFAHDAGLQGELVHPHKAQQIIKLTILDMSWGGLCATFEQDAEHLIKKGDTIVFQSVKGPAAAKGPSTIDISDEIECSIAYLIEFPPTRSVAIGCRFEKLSKDSMAKVDKFVGAWPMDRRLWSLSNFSHILRGVVFKPDFIHTDVLKFEYDGIQNDLLTAGLGTAGLAGDPPTVEDFTYDELRRLAIYANYRALIDITPGGGYGLLYGPNVSHDDKVDDENDKIAGKEFIAYSNEDGDQDVVTFMVQIPANFDPENPVIITAAASGSRGIYGAIASSGDWGLKRGFAVAYTDKGTGIGEKILFKHAYSQQVPEANWGKYVIQSIKFALYVLNLEYGNMKEDGNIEQIFSANNTLIIASSLSNGGGCSLRAAEIDVEGLIDGVAVTEPNICPVDNSCLTIEMGKRKWESPNVGRTLLDYLTFLNIYQPCANLDPAIKDSAPVNMMDKQICENRCRSLQALDLLNGDTVEEMAIDAQKRINDFGILEEQNILQPSHCFLQLSEAIAVAYTNSYGRFTEDDKLCGFSFIPVDPVTQKQMDVKETHWARLFGASSGLAPSEGMELIDNNSKDGPVLNSLSVSPDGIQDGNLQGMLCIRSLFTGKDHKGTPLKGKQLKKHLRVKESISKIKASGDLHGRPVIIAHGRQDALTHPNFTSRAYAAFNRRIEGSRSNLHYYEVTNAHHLDTLNELPGINDKFVPFHYYFKMSLNLMYDHLVNKTPLPPSQVVRTKTREVDEQGNLKDITKENVPPIRLNPKDEDRIIVEEGKIIIPD
jgi:hydroxybutyrate-dimer hydrolase